TWDWIHWSGIGGKFGRELATVAALTPYPPRVDYLLDLRPTWEEFRTHLKRNVRESLRHCYNSLKREGLSFELSVAETPEAVRRALPVFLALHAERAGLTETTPHPDRFEAGICRDFLYDVCEGLAERGAARVFLLNIHGHPVAARIGFVLGDELYLYYSGFDPLWRKYSVSTTIVAEAMRYAIDLGLAAVNLSPGTDVSKTRWGPRTVLYPEAIQTNRSVRSRVTCAAYHHLMNGNRPRWLAPILDRLPKREWL
ncbi:MAG: GNAT family N-acetyltransferase, partial [Polyangiaceae bacterium]